MPTVTDPMDRLLVTDTEQEWLDVFRSLEDKDQILLRAGYQQEIEELALHWGASPADLVQQFKALVQEIRSQFGLGVPTLRPIAQSAILLPIHSLRISRFNPRKFRAPSRIEAIAASIRTHGFDPSRALKVLGSEDGFEIFAGGTRWEAAKILGYQELPCYIYNGLSPEEISREADLDNEFDASHEPVSFVDLWEEAHRLATEEQWTHKQIADSKGVGRTAITERIKWHRVATPYLKEVARQGGVKESHVREITSILVPEVLHPWLSPEGAIDWLTDYCLRENAVTTDVKRKAKEVAAIVDRAAAVWADLPEDHRDLFVAELRDSAARTLGAIDAAERATAQRWAEQQSEEIAQIQKKLEEEEDRAREAAARMLQMEAIRSRYIFGDFLDQDDSPPEWNLWLGMAPDLGEEWGIAFDAVLATAEPGAVIFLVCPNWDRYRQVLEAAPDTLTVRDPLVLVKPEESSPDPRRVPNSAYGLVFYGAWQDGRLGGSLCDVHHLDQLRDGGELPESFWQGLIMVGSAPGQRVIDPFAGSAGVLRTALLNDREYWGYESNSDLYGMGVNLLAEADRGG